MIKLTLFLILLSIVYVKGGDHYQYCFVNKSTKECTVSNDALTCQSIKLCFEYSVDVQNIRINPGVYSGSDCPGTINLFPEQDTIFINAINPNVTTEYSCPNGFIRLGFGNDFLVTLSINGITFSNTTTSAIALSADLIKGGELSLTNCTFNNCHDSQHGGAVYAYNAVVATETTIFYNCSAPTGGAVYSEGTNGFSTYSSVGLYNTNFYYNSASQNGGALYTTTFLLMDNTVFVGNSAINGSAIYYEGMSISASNGTVFSNNNAKGAGAIYFSQKSSLYADFITIQQNTGQLASVVYSTEPNEFNLTGSFVEDNIAVGAAIVLTNPGSEIEVIGTTFSGNGGTGHQGPVDLDITTDTFEGGYFISPLGSSQPFQNSIPTTIFNSLNHVLVKDKAGDCPNHFPLIVSNSTTTPHDYYCLNVKGSCDGFAIVNQKGVITSCTPFGSDDDYNFSDSI